MKRFKILACAAITISAAGSAQNPPKPISRADYLKIIDGRFNAADTNHDGVLTKAEVAAQQDRDLEIAKQRINQQLQAAFARLDTNHDGKLTLAEFMATSPQIKQNQTPDQMIAQFDTNHDGKISAEEFRAPEMAKFNRVDANHDGIVTPQEQQAAGRK